MVRRKAVKRKKKEETKPEISPREKWEKIVKLAHEFFVARGRRHGHDFEDWLKAEKIVDSQYAVKKEK